MAAAYNSREIVDVFLRHRLLSSVLQHRGVTSLRRPNHAITSHRDVTQDEIQDHSSALSRLQFVLRCTSNDLERRSHSAFEAHVSALLLQDGEGVEHLRSLRAVTEELFRDTVNWGRIVAMMALGGVLCSEMVRMGGGEWVDDIAQWMEETLESPMIREWIEDNGGWDAFVELYGESRPAFSFLSPKTLFGLVLLGAAGIMLGLLVKALKLKFF